MLCHLLPSCHPQCERRRAPGVEAFVTPAMGPTTWTGSFSAIWINQHPKDAVKVALTY
jgi:hypothetical protein